MLGPPRLSKLLFEAAILGRLSGYELQRAAQSDPTVLAESAAALVSTDEDLRSRIVSIGLPILLPDGERVLRGADVRVGPEPGQDPTAERLVERGWVDLRSWNWARWRARAQKMLTELRGEAAADGGSRFDLEPWQLTGRFRPGALAAWVFRHEDEGERIKR